MSQLIPRQTSVNDICSAALKECGALGVGQTANQEDLTDAWARLQWMLQEWGEDSMLVWRERTITVQTVNVGLLPTDPDQGSPTRPVYYFPVGPGAGSAGGFDTEDTTAFVVNAVSAFTTSAYGMLLGPTANVIQAGLTVTDLFLNAVLGTVNSFGSLTSNIQASGSWQQGAVTIAMPGPPGQLAVPGMTVTDLDAGGQLLGKAVSWGTVDQTLTAGAAFNTSYSGVLMPLNPGWVTAGMDVTDVTTGHFVGTVSAYGAFLAFGLANDFIVSGTTTVINMVDANNFSVVPGMYVFDGAVGFHLVGQVKDYIGTVLTLVAPSLIDSSGSNDQLHYDVVSVWGATPTSGVLVLTDNVAFNSAGTSDVLSFSPTVTVLTLDRPAGFASTGMNDNLQLSGDSVLMLNAPIAYNSAGSGDLLQFDVSGAVSYESLAPRRIKRAFLRQPSSGGLPIDYPLEKLDSMGDYSRIALKGMVSFPGAYYYDPAWPLGRLFLYPLPTDAIYGVGIVVRDQLPFSFLSDSDLFDLPFIYYNAMYLNLAMRLRPHYGMRTFPGDQLPGLAQGARAMLKNTSVQISQLELPQELSRPGVYNIFSDRSY